MLHYLVLFVIVGLAVAGGFVWGRRRPGQSLLSSVLDPALAYLQAEVEKRRQEQAMQARLAEFQQVMAVRAPVSTPAAEAKPPTTTAAAS